MDVQRPRRDAGLVSGYASPGPPPCHVTESASARPKRMPSRGSGTVQSPSGVTETVSRSRLPSDVQRYTASRPTSQAAGATRVRTVSASSPGSTASSRCRMRRRPNSRHSGPNRTSLCQEAPSSLSVGARQTFEPQAGDLDAADGPQRAGAGAEGGRTERDQPLGEDGAGGGRDGRRRTRRHRYLAPRHLVPPGRPRGAGGQQRPHRPPRLRAAGRLRGRLGQLRLSPVAAASSCRETFDKG